MKKFFTVALILAIALTATIIPTFCVQAESNVITANVLNNNATTLRHVFDSPSDVFSYDGKVYVSTNSGTDVFQDGAVTKSELKADKMAYLNGLITLSDGKILFGEKSILGNYVAITCFNNTMYALENNVIYKFEYVDGEFSSGEAYIAPTLTVTNIAATENGCAYTAIDTDGYTNVIFIGERKFASIDEEISDLEYNGTIYALTASKIIRYADSYTFAQYPIVSAKQISVSDSVYVLTRTNNIESIALDLTSSYTLVAASGNIDWFYSAPISGSTRLNKIYVADSSENRVAVIDGTSISYLTGLNQPVAVEGDNSGNVYVAHYGNRIARFTNGILADETTLQEYIIDLKTDSNGDVFALTNSGKVVNINGETVKTDVTAFEYQDGWHYLTGGYIGDVAVAAADFSMDVAGNVFAVNGNTITAIVNGTSTTYTVQNAYDIKSIAVSKVQSPLVGYGDLILFDTQGKCVLTIDGSKVGSVDINTLYPIPEISSEAIVKTEGTIGTVTKSTYLFARPIEGEIKREIAKDEYIIVCKEISSPAPFVYCLIEDVSTHTLMGGYVYQSAFTADSYVANQNTEAKINTANTPLYKYPSLQAPTVDTFSKDDMVTILPFAINYIDSYGDGWFSDAYGNKWYRIAYGEKEGYVLTADTNVNFFADIEMPKTNATITQNAVLYRYDEATNSYVEFTAAGLYLSKDTRVAIELPFDTSRQYTKVVFYREGYGTIDAECYVRTEYIDFDGVDLVKIVALVAIAVAVITLILVFLHKRKISNKPIRHDLH